MSVFVLVCGTPPAANLANSIATLQVASWQKTQRIAAMAASKQTGSEISDSTQPKDSRHPSRQSTHKLTIALVSVVCLNLGGGGDGGGGGDAKWALLFIKDALN